MLSVIGIIIGLVVLVGLAYKNWSVLVAAPVAAIVVALFDMRNPFTMLTGTFMERFVGFAQSYFLILFFGAIFGKLMGECGAARTIAIKVSMLARKFPGKEKPMAVITLILISTVLTYGGISSFVVVFTLVAIAKNLFIDLDIPWHMYTCSVAGSGLWTMTMLPGTPSVQNQIPIRFLGTNAMAAPALSMFAVVISSVMVFGYVFWMCNRNDRRQEHFEPTGTEILKQDIKEDLSTENLPNLFRCLLPCIVIFIVLNVLNQGAVVALIFGCLACIAIFFKSFTIASLKSSVAAGGTNSTGAVMAACAASGFGGVVAAVSGYQMVLGALTSIPGPEIFQLIVAVNVAAGVTGSASSGLNIAFNSLTDTFLASGLRPEIIHRMACISSGGLDTLPHCSTVVNTLGVTKLTYAQGYKHYGVMTVIIPLITVVICGVAIGMGIFQ